MWAITWFISILCCEKYLLHWLHFYDFSPVCVLLWNVSDPRFLDPVSNLRLWRNHLFVLRNFHLYEFSTLPLENYLKRIFYASYKLSLLVKWKIQFIGLWFTYIILHWHNLKKIKDMHPSCSQNNVKSSSCFCDKLQVVQENGLVSLLFQFSSIYYIWDWIIQNCTYSSSSR